MFCHKLTWLACNFGGETHMTKAAVLRQSGVVFYDGLLVGVKSVIAARKLRAKHFAGDLFADPAWDLLLEIFEAHLEQRRISTSALFHAGGIPQSTNFRWLAKLEADGLIERSVDPLDARRTWVTLSSSAQAGMTAYFNELEGSAAG